jgi:hypothetical protein
LTTGSAIEELGKKGLEVYRYPEDVGSATTPHYMMFYVTERSGVVPDENRAPTGALPVEPSSQFRPETQVGPLAAGVIAGAVGAVGGAAVANRLGKRTASFFNRNFRTGDRVIDAGRQALSNIAVTGATLTGAGLGGTAAAAVVTAEGKSARDAQQLKYVVALYLNNKPRTEYAANWADTDLGMFGGITSEAAKALGGIMTGGGEGMAGRVDEALGALKTATGAGAALALTNADRALSELGGGASAAVSAFSGTTINPFKSQLFKNMNFRTFNFDYTFIPKNDREKEQVYEIIDVFKYYMHPTLGEDGFFVSYPAEFQIEFHYKDEGPNTHLFRTSSCALTNMKVEYGGQDFITLKGTAGAPSEISMSLTFLELELIYRERVLTAGF